ncbi:MAG TPA: hypothetical protein VMW60_02050 [Dehalococcoidales bacterium]|nr:hypothetical protein [Dehalococcoidales bacterium]
MEGWLYGIFTLAGVLAGGLFTYLGMRKQLKQQSELDSRHWKREVRGKPLLKLRDELAYMAAMQNEVVDAAHSAYEGVGVTTEQTKDRLDKALSRWDTYMANKNPLQSWYIQYNVELFNKVSEIKTDYRRAYENVWKSGELKVAELEEATRDSNKIWPKVIELQELINKRLEEL